MAVYLVDPGRRRMDRPRGVVRRDDSSQQAQGLIGWWALGGVDLYPGDRSLTAAGGNFQSSGAVPCLAGGPQGFGPCLYSTGGNSDRIEVPNNTKYHNLADYTLVIWALTRNGSGLEGLISKYNPDPGFILRFQSGALLMSDPSGSASVSGGSPTTNAWHCIVGRRLGAEGKIFLDGVQIAGPTNIGTATAASATPIYIGNDYTNGDRSINGWIADARIYNRGISDAEVVALYDPATRWDLYWQPSRRVMFNVGGAAFAARSTMVGRQAVTRASYW